VSIKLNAKKCEIYKVYTKGARDLDDQKCKINNEEKDCMLFTDYLKYLGIGLGAKRRSLIKYGQDKGTKFRYS
jgi:hypothetical protein